MELHNLQPAKGATKKRKRIGRGQGSGYGGTATKGHKGAQSRSGYKTKPHHQGGETPLHMTAPKIAKGNPEVKYKPISLTMLSKIAEKSGESSITGDLLAAHGLFKKGKKYKVLGGGAVTQPLQVSAHACSKSAQKAVEAQKGKIIIVK